MSSISFSNTKIVVAQDAISCDLDGEAVILHVGSGTYFGLNPIGAEIWNRIREERSVSEICEQLMTEYDVSKEQCETEVMALLHRLSEQGLVQMVPNEVSEEAVRS
jgi:PqqD family protein of HPr-rel-A system